MSSPQGRFRGFGRRGSRDGTNTPPPPGAMSPSAMAINALHSPRGPPSGPGMPAWGESSPGPSTGASPSANADLLDLVCGKIDDAFVWVGERHDELKAFSSAVKKRQSIAEDAAKALEKLSSSARVEGVAGGVSAILSQANRAFASAARAHAMVGASIASFSQPLSDSVKNLEAQRKVVGFFFFFFFFGGGGGGGNFPN